MPKRQPTRTKRVQTKRRNAFMNPIVEKVYQIGIIPVIAFNSVDEALPLCKALALSLIHI